jgi:hypothetical protein
MISTCIFGSTARGRRDNLSDKDLLVVATSKPELDETARRYCSTDWSISKFTHNQIRDMADRGSMFLQHIKQEGIIVRDDKGFLVSLMNGFHPRQEYESETRESFALLNDISGLSSTYWPTLCAADIAYGAIRNVAILRLASLGKYLFDFTDLIAHFSLKADLSSEESDALLDLRALKHGYRNRVATLSPHRVLAEALVVANKLFGKSRYTSTIGSDLMSGYRGLRLLELCLVKGADPRDLDSLSQHDPLAEAWAIIRDPRYPKPKLANEAWLQKMRHIADARFVSGCNQLNMSTAIAC